MARPRRNAGTAAKTAQTKKTQTETVRQENVQEEIRKTVVVEFDGRQVKAKDVLEKAEEAYVQSHPETIIETIELYIVPEQKKAYYVVNGEASEDFRVEI